MMKYFRHFFALFRDLFAFAYKNKAWWIVPMVITLLAFFVLIVAGETTAPFIYTLF